MSPIARRAGLVAVITAALTVTACTSGSPVAGPGASTATSASKARTTAAASSSPAKPRTTSAKPTPVGKPVHVSSVNGDGQVYGVGMPIVIRFSGSPTSKAAFEKAAIVTVNGAPGTGTWFWERPYADSPIEAHYRPQAYWPARAKIHVGLPVNGLSAGPGLSFANNLTLDYSIGDYHYSVVDAQNLRMTVYDNGKPVRVIAVSLGKASTATTSGVKVVSQKNNPVRMQGPGYDELVAYSVRITNSGEYVHYAPWNMGIGATSTSNGCTNVGQADAIWFYNFAQIGDVVTYPNAPGQQVRYDDGFGDWNVTWPEWLGGGQLTK